MEKLKLRFQCQGRYQPYFTNVVYRKLFYIRWFWNHLVYPFLFKIVNGNELTTLEFSSKWPNGEDNAAIQSGGVLHVRGGGGAGAHSDDTVITQSKIFVYVMVRQSYKSPVSKPGYLRLPGVKIYF
jgi:hypothetical protein